MKDYKYILFDLDGTLTDPGVGITNSVMYALHKFGIAEKDRTKLYKFIGPPLAESFQKFYGFSKEDAELGITYYREYYHDKGIYENEVYNGMKALLCRLKEADKELVVATSKPEHFAKQILEYFYLAEYFTYIAGATMDEKRVKKEDVIAYALGQCGIEDKCQAVMVGDREHDIIGAKKNGLASIGVLFGYGNREELVQAGADIIVSSPKEIGDVVLR